MVEREGDRRPSQILAIPSFTQVISYYYLLTECYMFSYCLSFVHYRLSNCCTVCVFIYLEYFIEMLYRV